MKLELYIKEVIDQISLGILGFNKEHDYIDAEWPEFVEFTLQLSQEIPIEVLSAPEGNSVNIKISLRNIRR